MTVVWFKIEEKTPPEKFLLMVTGPSGYSNHVKFLTLAHYDNEFRPPLADGRIRWIDVMNDALTDCGWVPTHWAYQVNLP